MTDRDAINAVFNAVCALAEKLTGQRLQFEMRLESGKIVWVTSENDQIVDWIKPEPTAMLSFEADAQGRLIRQSGQITGSKKAPE